MMDFLDDDSDDESQAYSLFGGKRGTIMLIDATKQMFDSNSFGLAINSVTTIMKNVAIRSSSDEIAVILYGTQLTSNSHQFNHIFIVQQLNKVNADIITELESLVANDCEFSSNFGHNDQYSIADAFWTSLLMFNKSKSKFQSKHLILFTCNDEPHSGNSTEAKQRRNRALKLASDLKDNGIIVQLIPLSNVSNKHFNYDCFYLHIFPHLNDEKTDALCMPSDLMNRVYSKSFKQRMLASIPFRLAPNGQQSNEFTDLSISVYVYSLFLEARKPTPVRINRKNHEEIVTETQRWSTDTGALVSSDDTNKRFVFGRENIYMSQNVMKDIKTDFDCPGISLLGFKPRSAIKTHLHLKPGHFIYPDETSIKGSTCLFNCLLKRCTERDKVAICRFVLRSTATPRLVALYPQIEVKSLSKPGGFHVIYLPYQEDIRDVPLKNAHVFKVEDKVVDKAKDIIKKLHFNYDPNNFPNPVLQTHWRAIEALALNLDNVDKFNDHETQPNYHDIDRKVGNHLKELNQLCGGIVTNVSDKKIEIPDNLEKLARDGKLGTLTVNILREFCRSKRINNFGTKKAEHIEAIQAYYSL